MKTIILIGGGHGHLNFIQRTALKNKNKIKIILISNVPYQYYSGMAFGYLEGIFSKEDMTLDLQDYCSKKDVEFILDDLQKIDKNQNTISLKEKGLLTYDLLSINIGARVNTYDLHLNQKSIPVKPLGNLEDILSELHKLKRNSDHAREILVLGTGAAGIELGFALLNRSKAMNINSSLKFVGSHEHLLKGFSKEISHKLMIYKEEAAASYLTSQKGVKVEDGTLILKHGHAIAFDLLIIATGARGHDYDFMKALPLDDQNFIRVDSNLKVISSENIFALGDCISLEKENHQIRNGVLALEQSKILSDNLMNYLNEKSLKPYKQRKNFLAIIALGKDMGLLSYGKFYFFGKWTMKLKIFIDKRYMKQLKK